MFNKKVIISLFTLLSVFSLASCDTETENTPLTSAPAVTQEVTTVAPAVTDAVTQQIAEATEETAPLATTIITEEAPAVTTIATEAPTTTVLTTTEAPSAENTGTTKQYSGITKILVEKAATGSPLETGYADYETFMNRYYDLSFAPYSNYFEFDYTLNRDSVTLGSAWILYKSSGTITSVKTNVIDVENLDKISKIYEHINNVVGEGNYSVHDAYTERYYEEYGPSSITQESGYGCHIDIVLNSDLEKYKSASPADKHRFIVKFEIDENNVLKSEYELYQAKKDHLTNLINELNAQATDIAFGVDDVYYSNYSEENVNYTSIHTPFRNPVNKSCENATSSLLPNGVEPYYHKTYGNSAYIVGKDTLDTNNLHADISIYAAPGYDEAKIKEFLHSTISILDKYNVERITADVLKNESDITKFKNCNGYVPQQTIESSYRKYLTNLPDTDFDVPGK
ncbi:MAG: hypothetical protein IJP18_02510 [Oscillospiraceae bacterium]|nr:hypothetical protein [Oscillospiraceae bacterium]